MLAMSILTHEVTALLELFHLYKSTIVWNGLDKFKTHSLLCW